MNDRELVAAVESCTLASQAARASFVLPDRLAG